MPRKCATVLLILALLMIISIPVSVHAQNNASDLSKQPELGDWVSKYLMDAVALHIDTPRAIVNGSLKPINADNLNVVPIILDGNTLIPARFIAESFGAEVLWDEASSQVRIRHGKSTAVLTLNSDIMTVDNKEIKLEVPPQIIHDTTMIPLRKLAEDLLGKKIFYSNGLIVLGDESKVSEVSRQSSSAILINTEFVGTRSLSSEEMSFHFGGADYYVPKNESSKLLKKLGNGDAGKTNNYGFVGWDSSKRYKFYRYGYPAGSPEIYIYNKVDANNGEVEVASINISKVGTSNGIHVGDSYRLLQYFYGYPLQEVDLENGLIKRLYAHGPDMRMAFYFDKNTNLISEIQILYSVDGLSAYADTFDPEKIVPDETKPESQHILTEQQALEIVRGYEGGKVKITSKGMMFEKYYSFHVSDANVAYDYLDLVDQYNGGLYIYTLDGKMKAVNSQANKPETLTADDAQRVLEARVNPIIESYTKLPNIDRDGTQTIDGKTYFVFDVGYTGTNHPVKFTLCYLSEDGTTFLIEDFEAEKIIPFSEALFKQYLEDSLPK